MFLRWLAFIFIQTFVLWTSGTPLQAIYPNRYYYSTTPKWINPATIGGHLPVGHCYEEIPTSVLIQPGQPVPMGNASDPARSIIVTCCPGYERDPKNSGICLPKCKSPCRNGRCIAPDVCQCFSGFAASLSGDCVDTCPLGCLNGWCNWGDCICNPGYVLDVSRKFCVPVCSRNCGLNENCTAPETCACSKGYGLNIQTRVCEPQCSPPCGNGKCVLPNVCSCFPGFKLLDGTCQANCTRGCFQGRCIANEVCTCDIGWTLNPSGNQCDPVCQGGCPNGICTGPNVCTCIEGFKKEGNLCKPECKKGCHKGTCVAPNVCACKPGYTINARGNICKLVET